MPCVVWLVVLMAFPFLQTHFFFLSEWPSFFVCIQHTSSHIYCRTHHHFCWRWWKFIFFFPETSLSLDQAWFLPWSNVGRRRSAVPGGPLVFITCRLCNKYRLDLLLLNSEMHHSWDNDFHFLSIDCLVRIKTPNFNIYSQETKVQSLKFYYCFVQPEPPRWFFPSCLLFVIINFTIIITSSTISSV
jgi:hypothetical protein